MTMTITYFLQCRHGGPIKIGKSTRDGLAARIATLQTGNPNGLRVTNTLDGDQERALHKRFAAIRLTGEWFEASPELAALAKATPGDATIDETAELCREAYRAGWRAAAGLLAAADGTDPLPVIESLVESTVNVTPLHPTARAA